MHIHTEVILLITLHVHVYTLSLSLSLSLPSLPSLPPLPLSSDRVVADDQRSLALGLQSFSWRIIGAVPGPLIFGALFDHACLSWQNECGRRGNCWIYDTQQLSISLVALGVPCLILTTILHFITILTYPNHKDSNEEVHNVVASSEQGNSAE